MTTDKDFSPWSRWHVRDQLQGMKYPGIYAVIISDADISGDEFGMYEEIIYIGMTNAKNGLGSRLRSFDRTLRGQRGHGGADRVRYKHRNYEELNKSLFVAVKPFPCDVRREDPDDLRVMGDVAREEYICFAIYKQIFGRLPEFNDKKRSKKYTLTVGRGLED